MTGERFENPLYRSKIQSKSDETQEKAVNIDEPVSLVALQKTAESDQMEEIEMDVENF
jgi:hypothetical protein